MQAGVIYIVQSLFKLDERIKSAFYLNHTFWQMLRFGAGGNMCVKFPTSPKVVFVR